MNLLLDTHTLIWFLQDDESLSGAAANAIQNPSNVNYISMASFWEMAIKVSLDKLKLDTPFDEILRTVLENGFKILNIDFEHTVAVSKLPLYHRDPFDRLIIVQGLQEGFTIISNETTFDKYGVNRIW